MTDLSVQKLILENARLKKSKIDHCRGCAILQKHPCSAFYICRRLGVVNPDTDGCSKKVVISSRY